VDKVSEDIGKFYHHYPRVVAVVTARLNGRDNAMAVAWHTPLSFKPPLYGVAVSPKRFTYELVADSHEFAVNFLPSSRVDLVAATGGSKGQGMDKFGAFQIERHDSVKAAVPILKDAYTAYECVMVDDRLYGDHRLLVGEIVAIHYLEGAIMVDGTIDLGKVSPVLYLGNEQYLDIEECRLRTVDREFCVDCLNINH
jgi:flavin reductase (DIM6/NTAB) family NADH-FMN oxidoreductase RutF